MDCSDVEFFYGLVERLHPALEKGISTAVISEIIDLTEMLLRDLNSQEGLRCAIEAIAEFVKLPVETVTPFVTIYCIGRFPSFTVLARACYRCGGSHGSGHTKVVVKTATGPLLVTQISPPF